MLNSLSYDVNCFKYDTVKCTPKWLGIGTSTTWHGYLDARICAGNGDTAVVTSLYEDQDTPRNLVAIEAKLGS